VHFVFKTKRRYYAVFLLLCQAFFYIIFLMKNIQALFIDCDNVLYDDTECSNNSTVKAGLNKTLEQFDISTIKIFQGE